ncbi:hypothetical protein D3C72_1259040 [compost metagenome]
MKLFQQLIKLVVALGCVRLMHFQHGADVFLNREAAENRCFLRQITDAETGATIHRHGGDIIAVDGDLAGIDRHQARDHIKAGGFAGAVRAEQSHGLATAHDQRNAVDDAPRIIGLRQAMRDQRALIGGLVRRWDRVRGSAASAAEYL